MIVPTKHLPTRETLLGVGAVVLLHLSEPVTVSRLWERTRLEPRVGTFERFVLALDLLFILGALEFADGLIRRTA